MGGVDQYIIIIELLFKQTTAYKEKLTPISGSCDSLQACLLPLWKATNGIGWKFSWLGNVHKMQGWCPAVGIEASLVWNIQVSNPCISQCLNNTMNMFLAPGRRWQIFNSN